MSKFLKTNSTYRKYGVTLEGNNAGNQGILHSIGFDRINRAEKRAIASFIIYVDSIAKENNEIFDVIHLEITGDDFDIYIAQPANENEVGMPLLMSHRCYKYLTDKNLLPDWVD